jgi:hypothetical protein
MLDIPAAAQISLSTHTYLKNSCYDELNNSLTNARSAALYLNDSIPNLSRKFYSPTMKQREI